MNKHYQYNQGDMVRYNSGGSLCEKYPEDIKRDKVGEVISKVQGSELLVISFGGDAFLCHPSNLSKHTFRDKSLDENVANDQAARKWARSEENDGAKSSKKKD